MKSRLAFAALAAASLAVPAVAAIDGQSPALTNDQVKALKYPIPFSKASITRGRTNYMARCTTCHGANGKAQVDVMGNATDLTTPAVYASGTGDGEIFRSIRDGAGLAMLAFKNDIHQENDIWDLVNYIHSLWPESARPALVDGN